MSITRSRTSAILLALSFSLLPLYPFTSGAFQPVDLIIVIFSTYILFTVTYDEMSKAKRIISPFLPFLCWIIGVNSYYIIVSGHLGSHLLATIQLIYVFFILAVYQIGLMRIMKLREGYIYILISLILLASSPLLYHYLVGSASSYGQYRQPFSFNNPNQLGYFSLLLLCMLLIYIYFYRNSSFMINKITHAGCAFVFILANLFGFISASRGALAGIVILDIAILMQTLKKSRLFVIMVVLSFFFICALCVVEKNFSEYFKGSITRLTHKELIDKDDLLYRTVQRIDFDDDKSLILGSGPIRSYDSGMTPLDRRYEVHNSILGIFSQYGLIGVLLIVFAFSAYFWRVGLTIPHVVIFASIALYNLSHYGLRFRIFWIVLSLVAASSMFTSEQRKAHFSLNTQHDI